MTYTAEFWIDHLDLKPHPEGGYYTETYRGKPERLADGARAVSTGIYFLLRAGEVSHLHKIDADEMWHFYAGDPLNVYCLHENGRAPILHLGPDAKAGQWFQGVVPAGVWFGAELAETKNTGSAAQGYSLMGCTVAPGFEFSGFELAKRSVLTQAFPQHAEMIERLTPPD